MEEKEEKTKKPRRKGVGKGRPPLYGARMATMTIRILPSNKKWLKDHFGPKNVSLSINKIIIKLRNGEF